MKNHRFAKQIGALLIAGCLTAFGAAAAMAAPDESGNVGRGPGVMTMIDRGAPEVESVPGIDPAALAKQREIDAYVFGTEGSEELAKRGFKATYTAPVGDRVEIGILPYEESHAEFLYEKFGRDQIVVVEGFEAVLMEGPVTILPAPAPGAYPGSGGAAPSAGGGASGSGGAAAPGAIPAVPEPAPDAGGNQAGPITDPDQPVSAVPDGTAVDQPAYAATGAADAAGAAEAMPLSADQIAKTGTPWTSPYLYAAIAAAALILVLAVLAARRKRLAARNE